MRDSRLKNETKRAFKIFTILICFFLFSFLTVSLYGAIERVRNPRPYFEYVDGYAKEYGVPTELVYAVMLTESGFDPWAVSPSGACGLMQLMPSTFKWICERLLIEFSPKDVFDPAVNIRCGVWYLSYLRERFGDWKTVLAAYNAGEGIVSDWLRDRRLSNDGIALQRIPYRETERYCRRVSNVRARYFRLYN